MVARRKVNLTYIIDDSTRKSTFKKRRNGLIKKIDELATLCGIKACLILYSCFESQPLVWPSIGGVKRMLHQFESTPESDKGKRIMDHENFLNQRIEKANQQLKKKCLLNRELELTKVMFENLTGESSVRDMTNLKDLNDLKFIIQEKLKQINRFLAL